VFFDEAGPFGRVGYIAVLDLTEPAAPVVVSYGHPGVQQAWSAAVVGDHVVGVFGNGIAVLDVSRPTEPTLVPGSQPSQGYSASGLAVSGLRAYVHTQYVGVDGRSGLVVLDLANLPALVELGFLPLMGDASPPAPFGDRAFVIERERRPDGANMLHAVDVAEPATPRSIAQAELVGPLTGAAASAGSVFAVSNTGRL
jgi:hypothetical protein